MSAVSPERIRPKTWYTLLVYAHLEDTPVFADALMRLGLPGETYQRTSTLARESIELGTKLLIVPECPGCHFSPSQASVILLEDLNCTTFSLEASPDLPGYILDEERKGCISFYVGPLLIGRLSFSVRITLDKPTSSAPLAGYQWQTEAPYRSIFVSYAHEDKIIVDKLERVYKVLGDNYLRDVNALRSGQVWEDAIDRMIDGADIFQLCWSRAASASTQVEREWRHAIKLEEKGPSFIRPVYWEQPMPDAPHDLEHLHFAYLDLDW